jgi:hypothetical protein
MLLNTFRTSMHTRAGHVTEEEAEERERAMMVEEERTKRTK